MKTGNHFVYILRCKDATYYTGYATDIHKRVKVHEEGKGAKYTRGRGPFTLVYEEVFSTKREALQREYEIKQLPRSEKEELFSDWGDEDEHSTKLSK